jgi:maleate isomerase
MEKFGIVIPSSNTTIEKEFNEKLKGMATVHTSRIRLRAVNVEELTRFEDDVIDETGKLADAGVDVIGLGCTSGSFVKGSRQYLELEERMEEVSGVPCVTASGSVVRALKALGSRKVALVTPYIAEVTKLEETLLNDHGFTVTARRYAGIVENTVIGWVAEEEVARWVKGLGSEDFDTVFISCTNLRTFGILAGLESALGVPVISSNSAILWDMIQRTGLKGHNPGLGRLYEITPYL